MNWKKHLLAKQEACLLVKHMHLKHSQTPKGLLNILLLEVVNNLSYNKYNSFKVICGCATKYQKFISFYAVIPLHKT